MVVVTLEDIGKSFGDMRDVLWVDGFLPEKKVFSSFIDEGDLRNWQLNTDEDKKFDYDSFFLSTLQVYMSGKIDDKIKADPEYKKRPFRGTDIFLIKPSLDEYGMSNYSVIHSENTVLPQDIIDAYRVICMVSHNSNVEFRNEILEAVDYHKFDIRQTDTYSNLPLLQKYLTRLTEEIDTVFLDPQNQIKMKFKAIGLNSIDGSIF